MLPFHIYLAKSVISIRISADIFESGVVICGEKKKKKY